MQAEASQAYIDTSGMSKTTTRVPEEIPPPIRALNLLGNEIDMLDKELALLDAAHAQLIGVLQPITNIAPDVEQDRLTPMEADIAEGVARYSALEDAIADRVDALRRLRSKVRDMARHMEGLPATLRI